MAAVINVVNVSSAKGGSPWVAMIPSKEKTKNKEKKEHQLGLRVVSWL